MEGFAPVTGLDAQGMARFGSDEHLYVFFALKPVANRKKSIDAGMPVYDSVEFVHIQQPGEKDYLERPATEQDKQRFARQYQAFQEGRTDVPDGTPVEMLFPGNPEIPPTLKHLKIFTIQQLANLTEEGIGKVGMGARQWVEAARQYLGQASNGKEYLALKQSNEDLQNKVEVQERTIAVLQQAVERLEATVQKANAPDTRPPVVRLPKPGEDVQAHLVSVEGMPAPDLSEYVAAPAAEPEQPAAEPAPTKKRGGWPKGKPRKPPFGGE